ncbi:MAG: S8 family serine peptidase, partial [Thermoleophilaceae bacterium]
LALLAGVAWASHEDPSSPDDPLYADQWGPQQVRVEPAWHRSVGEGAVVAIVDSGVDLDHPDLAANVVRGNTFLDCGKRGCGNGDWQSGPPDQRDGHPHGTHVAGIAAAVTDNGVGIAGVAPEATILPVRVLDDEGSGSFEDIAFGIRYATKRGADVINLSLSADPGVGQAIVITGLATETLEAIQYANSKGVTVVASAGNDAFAVCNEPGFDPGVVCVGASERRELKASYSNLPVKPDLLGVTAPGGELTYVLVCGEGVLSTVPPGEGGDYCDYPSDLAYDEYVGTSMAAPHASGVASLLAAQRCTREQILELFKTTSRQGNTETRGVFTPVYGYGIVDADAATVAAQGVCNGDGDSGGGGEDGRGDDDDDDGRGDDDDDGGRDDDSDSDDSDD